MEQLEITLTSPDHRALDNALSAVVASIPTGETHGSEIEVLARESGAQGRRLLVFGASEKVVPAFMKVDLPDVVTVRLRMRD